MKGAAAIGLMAFDRTVTIHRTPLVVGRDRVLEARWPRVAGSCPGVRVSDRPAYRCAAVRWRPVERKVLAGGRLRRHAEGGRSPGIEIRAHRRDVMPGRRAVAARAREIGSAGARRPMRSVPNVFDAGRRQRAWRRAEGGTRHGLARVAIGEARLVDGEVGPAWPMNGNKLVRTRVRRPVAIAGIDRGRHVHLEGDRGSGARAWSARSRDGARARAGTGARRATSDGARTRGAARCGSRSGGTATGTRHGAARTSGARRAP